ncbi:MAG: ATP-binding protein [Okeania sp. SIO3I5]|uniref:AAA family ATPase n=1 Tax=Okeania sp. SIO3I5 TaxID=2607805 RepID=UPI0013B61D62|nr:ATP-binding protein [Okeania sp. SIO3I5]NEQ38282.1 ATP-binding protein [Okeania sp. SIO3I5]
MKIKIQNLGVLKQAEFTLADLTIICGSNNTGKTYAAYALFGFLFTWERILSIDIDDRIQQLFAEGVIHIDIQEYIKQSQKIVTKGCQEYTKKLPNIFAAAPEKFKQTKFDVIFDVNDINLKRKFEYEISLPSGGIFSLTKNDDSTELVVILLVQQKKVKIPTKVLKEIVADALKKIIFSQLFPKPFVASAERTGAAIFRKELNFSHNLLLKEMSQTDYDIDPRELLLRGYQDYPFPVGKNVDFTRELERISKKRSFLYNEHPEVLNDFADIIGGEYRVTSNDELYYLPQGEQVRLSMWESSSAVRSLLDIGFYLKHEAQLGDLLMVDEPELNLHPENQRRVARLFARLINLGIKVFITTHSDYIIKELNTLIMLNHDKPHLKRIAEEEGYQTEELISAEKIKVYIAEEKYIQREGNQRKTKCQTLTLANIDPEMGIEARSFDTTIEKMNRIQEAIVWGED